MSDKIFYNIWKVLFAIWVAELFVSIALHMLPAFFGVTIVCAILCALCCHLVDKL